jgi:hypothetical protein
MKNAHHERDSAARSNLARMLLAVLIATTAVPVWLIRADDGPRPDPTLALVPDVEPGTTVGTAAVAAPAPVVSPAMLGAIVPAPDPVPSPVPVPAPIERPRTTLSLQDDPPAQPLVAPTPETPRPVSFLEWAAERRAEREAAAADAGAGDAAPGDEPTSPFDFEIGVDWTNAYYFRGFLQEREGVIVQPWFELGVTLTEEDSDVAVRAFGGTWSSIHDERTDADTSSDVLEYWYELDLYGGVSVSVDAWTLRSTYWAYLSPSDAFDTIHELEFALGYDDAAHWGDRFALNPEVLLAVEVGPDGNDGVDRGTYLQLGLTPTLQLDQRATMELRLPIAVGLSVDDYYQDESGDDDTFGFFDVGIEASIALPASGAGQWSIHGGVHWLTLGDNTKEIAERSDEWIGSFGFSLSF